MLKNYLKLSLRNLLKSKTFSIVNIFSLAIGMASFILISLWIRQELSVDQFHEKKDRIYRVMTNLKEKENVITGNTTPMILKSHLENELPEIKESIATSWSLLKLFRYKNQRLQRGGLAVDPGFLRLFSFKLLKGNASLTDINSILISDDLATSLFGNDDPMDKVVQLNNQDYFKVTGVFESPGPNSTLGFQFLLPFEYFKRANEWAQNSWESNSIQTYVELKPGASIESVQQKMRAIPGQNGQKEFEYFLHPLSDWYLYSNFENGQIAGGRIEIVRFFAIIAFCILLVACVNFTNLSTVRSEKRAKEVGIRKVIGVRKANLVIQFLGESLFLSFIAGILAFGFAVLGLPLFNQITEAHLQIDLADPILYISLFVFILITGTLAGLYPALYLSSFHAITVLKGKVSSLGSAFTPRKALVVLQFAFAVGMIISSIIINKQILYAQERKSGYLKEKLIYYQYFGGFKNYPLLKENLLASGIASSVTHTSAPITDVWDMTSKVAWPGKNRDQVTEFKILCAEEKLEETFGLQILQGRSFDLNKFYTDSSACLLNETAFKIMGLKDPVGQMIDFEGSRWKIVGISKDFVLQSPYAKSEPLLVIGAKGWFNIIHIKLSDRVPITESLKATEDLIKKYNPAFPFEYYFVDQVYAQKFNNEKKVSTLAAIFTVLTILISCLGLFGLATYIAQSKVKEIGIRKVLGATIADINLMLTKDFLKLLIVSICVASPIAFIAMKNWLENYEYRIVISWWIFPVSGLMAIVLALTTVGVIAVKAAIANPAKSLRSE